MPELDSTDLFQKASARWEELADKIQKLATAEARSKSAFEKVIVEHTSEEEAFEGTCIHKYLH